MCPVGEGVCVEFFSGWKKKSRANIPTRREATIYGSFLKSGFQAAFSGKTLVTVCVFAWWMRSDPTDL